MFDVRGLVVCFSPRSYIGRASVGVRRVVIFNASLLLLSIDLIRSNQRDSVILIDSLGLHDLRTKLGSSARNSTEST